MIDYLEKAKNIESEIIENRRYIHENPELGYDLENTVNFVMNKLKEYGIEGKILGKAGVTATIGSGSPVILLRGDMDALKMDEQTGLSFASKNGATHSCGHDTHTSMLLGAAKLLKENEENLKGTVKLMFQPAEEILGGALDMLENGILENPKVDAAVGLHVYAGDNDTEEGKVLLARGKAMTSADAYRIEITGRPSHGSMTEKGIDAIVVAANIVISFQTILAREISMFDNCVVLVGTIKGGDTLNTTPGYAEMEITTRAATEQQREFLAKRVKEIAKGVGNTFRAEVNLVHLLGAPALFNDEDLVDDVVEFSKEVVGEENVKITPMSTGTEDFAYVSQKVPSLMLNIGAGSIEEGYEYGNHHPKFNIDENVLHKGTALYANIATRYLEKHHK